MTARAHRRVCGPGAASGSGGGGGGGKDDLAQGGGQDVRKIDAALAAIAGELV